MIGPYPDPRIPWRSPPRAKPTLEELWRGTCSPVVVPKDAGTAGIAIPPDLNDYSIGISLPKP